MLSPDYSVSHIRDCGVCLPHKAQGLYLTLSELHDIGVLLLLGDHTRCDCHVVLNIPELTKEVHELLFSRSAIDSFCKKSHSMPSQSYNIGLLPNGVLQKILPPFITKQCLSYLQYCQEIKCDVFVQEALAASAWSVFLFLPSSLQL